MKNKYSTSAEQQTGEMPGKIMPPHFTCFYVQVFLFLFMMLMSSYVFTAEDFCGAI